MTNTLKPNALVTAEIRTFTHEIMLVYETTLANHGPFFDVEGVLAQLLATFIAEQWTSATTAAIEMIAEGHDQVLGNCRCGQKLNEYEGDDLTWEEHIKSLSSPNVLSFVAEQERLAYQRAAKVIDHEIEMRKQHQGEGRDYDHLRPLEELAQEIRELESAGTERSEKV